MGRELDTYRWSIKNSTFQVFHVTMMSEPWKLNPALLQASYNI